MGRSSWDRSERTAGCAHRPMHGRAKIDAQEVSVVEISDLRSFVAVAEELHFGRAAERLHVTQPPLSRQIRRLEDELDVRLFHRTTRRVDLTDAGRAFLGEARQVLAAAEKAAGCARSAHRGETGRLAIGAVTPAIDGFLPDVV